MPAEPAPAASPAFKHWFDAARYRAIADQLSAAAPGFDRQRFLDLTLTGLDERELMDRVRQTATACAASLPGAYRDQLAVVRTIAPQVGHAFVAIALCDFVARYGLDDFDHSLDALREMTRHGSAEFAVRPFIQRDQPRALATMQRWALDPDEHVRRLASEGSRPRLPWGARLSALIADPSPTAPILEALKADPALYVRKSVANHLNDIAKDHPSAVLARVTAWDRSEAGTAWIVRHALRTLVKRGDPRALALLGASDGAAVVIDDFTASPARLRLGDTLTLAATIRARPRVREPQRLVIDYVVHYVKASGATSAKVFKWTENTLAPGAVLTLVKRQTIRDFTTRRHHAGVHRVELQINGQRLAETTFTLTRPRA